MPLYFFDFSDNSALADDIGTELASEEAMQAVAKQTLLDIARDRGAAHPDRNFLSLTVRDKAGVPIYVATFHYTGLSLRGRP